MSTSHTYSRQSWTRAPKLTLRSHGAPNRGLQAEFTDGTGRVWSQSQIEQAVKLGRMKVTCERKRRNAAGIIISRTLTVRVRPIVRQRGRS